MNVFSVSGCIIVSMLWNVFPPPSAADYAKKIAELKLNTRAGRASVWQQFGQLVQTQAIHQYRNQLGRVETASGDYLRNVHNAWQCFIGEEADNCRYVRNMVKIKDSMDCDYGGVGEQGYQNVETYPMPRHSMATYGCYGGNDVYYSYAVMNSKYVLASAGLKKGEYVIFNSKYTAAEYEKLFRKIQQYMLHIKEWGEYFPIEHSLFAYNETNAQQWYPLTQEEVRQHSWRWRAPDQLSVPTVIASTQLPDTIAAISDAILQQAISCTACQRPFKIVPAELTFYRAHDIPLPERCYYCRAAVRQRWYNPQRLVDRQCTCRQTDHQHQGRCTEQIVTTYATDRPEKVYCDRCYRETVL